MSKEKSMKNKNNSVKKYLWCIMCYCDDEIEAENVDEAYKIFCQKHNFNEKNAEFRSYSRIFYEICEDAVE